MELKNKKTGEIGYLIVGRGSDYYIVCNDEWGDCGKYNSLAELCEEWEDYKPKEYWCIDYDGSIFSTSPKMITGKNIEIGNKFETEEEAKKALEKLKAWKLLKDECNIRFDGIIRDKRAMLKGVNLIYDSHQVTFKKQHEIYRALYLLFGGEE